MSRSTETPRALRRALLVDAAGSVGMGLLLTIDAGALEPMLGLPALFLRGVGLFVIAFAAALVLLATRPAANRGIARAIVAGNVLWVFGSVLLLAVGPFRPTLLGELFIGAQAAAVALFAYLEHAALRGQSGATLHAAR